MERNTIFKKLDKLIEFLKGNRPEYFQKIERIIIVNLIEEFTIMLSKIEKNLRNEKIDYSLYEKKKYEIDNSFEFGFTDEYLADLLLQSSIDSVKENILEYKKINKQKKKLIAELNFDKGVLDWSSEPNLYKIKINDLFETVRQLSDFSVLSIVMNCESILYRLEVLKFSEQLIRKGKKIELAEFAENHFLKNLIDKNHIITNEFVEFEEDPIEFMLKMRNTK